MNRLAAVFLSGLTLACAGSQVPLEISPQAVPFEGDSIPIAQSMKRAELLDSLSRILRRTRVAAECPMPVATAETTRTVPMPVARPRHVPWMPVARSGCVNPLFQPARVPD